MNLTLDLLILNAGVMIKNRKFNSHSHELTMASNYLGHFLLLNPLLPKLRLSSERRHIIVTSSLYNIASRGIDINDLFYYHRKYTLFGQYAQSKLAMMLMGKELIQRGNKICKERKLRVYNFHPGLVRTNLVYDFTWYLHYCNRIFELPFKMLQKSPRCGAYTIVHCSTKETEKEIVSSSECEGEFWVNSKIRPTDFFVNCIKV